MNKNILAENMRRFGTKNLNEQTTPGQPQQVVDANGKPVEDFPYDVRYSQTAGITYTPTEKTILAAKDGDPHMEQLVADWIAAQPNEQAAQRYIQQIATQKPQLFKRILQFFERNQTNDELRRKQIRQATRKYQASQIDSDKVAQAGGVAGAVGAILMLTFGRIGDMFREAFKQQ